MNNKELIGELSRRLGYTKQGCGTVADISYRNNG